MQISNFKSPVLAAIVLALAGCSANQSAQTTPDPFFQSPDETPLSARLFDTQAARGARADATLYPQHFDGTRLNSLGKSKLDLMLHDTDSEPPLKLYIDGQASDPAWAGRADAVKKHLASIGLANTQYEVIAGPNPTTWHPVAKDLEAMSKPDTAKPATEPTPGMSSASAPPSPK
jgi:hypothetical protein